MNLKTWAENNGHTLEEAKKITGMTHWNQTMADNVIESDDVETESKQIEEIVEIESKEEADPKVIDLSLRCLGEKSPYWHLRNQV